MSLVDFRLFWHVRVVKNETFLFSFRSSESTSRERRNDLSRQASVVAGRRNKKEALESTKPRRKQTGWWWNHI